MNTKDRCDFCSQMDYRNKRLKEMLWSVLGKIKTYCPNLFYLLLKENCVLDSWYKDNKRAMESEERRLAEEKEKERKIRAALCKLTAEEAELLGLK